MGGRRRTRARKTRRDSYHYKNALRDTRNGGHAGRRGAGRKGAGRRGAGSRGCREQGSREEGSKTQTLSLNP